ncbi:MAG: hypothetical protein ACTHM6_02945 [Tepidisphaeraceae bacterium]
MTKSHLGIRRTQASERSSDRSIGMEPLETRQFFAAHVAALTAPTAQVDVPAFAVLDYALQVQPTRMLGNYFGMGRLAAIESFLSQLPQFGGPAQATTPVASPAMSRAEASEESASSPTQTAAAVQAASFSSTAPESADEGRSVATTPDAQATSDDATGNAKAVIESVKATPAPTTDAPAPLSTAKVMPIDLVPNTPMSEHIGPTAAPAGLLPNLLAMVNANVAGASGAGVSAAPIHHGSSTTIDADASAAANAVANPAPTAGQPMLATLDVAPLSARPLWQRIAAIATTALVLVVAWVLRRNKQRSVAPAGERFTDL